MYVRAYQTVKFTYSSHGSHEYLFRTKSCMYIGTRSTRKGCCCVTTYVLFLYCVETTLNSERTVCCRSIIYYCMYSSKYGYVVHVSRVIVRIHTCLKVQGPQPSFSLSTPLSISYLFYFHFFPPLRTAT